MKWYFFIGSIFFSPLFLFSQQVSFSYDSLASPKSNEKRIIFEYSPCLSFSISGNKISSAYSNNNPDFDLPYTLHFLSGRKHWFKGIGRDQFISNGFWSSGLFYSLSFRSSMERRFFFSSALDAGFRTLYAADRWNYNSSNFSLFGRISVGAGCTLTKKSFCFINIVYHKNLFEESFFQGAIGLGLVLNKQHNGMDSSGNFFSMKSRWSIGTGYSIKLMPTDNPGIYPIIDTNSTLLYLNGIGSTTASFPTIFCEYSDRRLINYRIEVGYKISGSGKEVGDASSKYNKLSDCRGSFQIDRPVRYKSLRAKSTGYIFFGLKANYLYKNFHYQYDFYDMGWSYSFEKGTTQIDNVNNAFFLQLPVGLRGVKKNIFLEVAFNIAVLAGVRGENKYDKFYYNISPTVDPHKITTSENYQKIFYPMDYVLNELSLKVGYRF